ncbi:endonuclease domain-containing protein [bacterium]|nr:endonuclease domain-containing protein [bacterium]
MKEVCRSFRRNGTPAEKLFWQVVRNRQVRDYKFNRQYPIIFEIDNMKQFFVADFYCHQLGLVIEIDGGIHETQKDYDKLRTEIINRLSINVFRFSNREVLNDIDVVVGKLKKIIDKLTLTLS